MKMKKSENSKLSLTFPKGMKQEAGSNVRITERQRFRSYLISNFKFIAPCFLLLPPAYSDLRLVTGFATAARIAW